MVISLVSWRIPIIKYLINGFLDKLKRSLSIGLQTRDYAQNAPVKNT